jgi:hypothetical protein
MSAAQFRRAARLENRASAYIRRNHLQQDEGKDAHREGDFVTVANIGILLLYGDPRIGEPLTKAWQHCLQSPAWRALRAEHPDALVVWGYNPEATPFSDDGARVLAEYFRRCILPNLPGADAFEKLGRLLAEAPLWLLYFTHGDTAAILLGLQVPDPFAQRHYARPAAGYRHLPEESFTWRLLPDGSEDEFLSGVRERERKHSASLEALTPRQRLREERSQQRAKLLAPPNEEVKRQRLNRLVSSPLSPRHDVLNCHYRRPLDVGRNGEHWLANPFSREG